MNARQIYGRWFDFRLLSIKKLKHIQRISVNS